MARYSAKFVICKGKMGCFQASPIPPTWTEEKTTDREGNPVVNSKCTREGAIMIEMAPFLREENGNKYYDWSKEKKVSFALGIPDIAQICEKAGTKFSLVHVNDNTNETKSMLFTPGEGDYEGTTKLMLSSKTSDGTSKMSSIAFSNGEFTVFCLLLKSYLPVILGWINA